MITRRLLELGAMLAIRDGVVALIAPRRHSLLWRFGPEGYKRTVERFAQCPNLVRVLAAAEIGGGMWLALRQYPEG
jgi:hypothetical protein